MSRNTFATSGCPLEQPPAPLDLVAAASPAVVRGRKSRLQTHPQTSSPSAVRQPAAGYPTGRDRRRSGAKCGATTHGIGLDAVDAVVGRRPEPDESETVESV